MSDAMKPRHDASSADANDRDVRSELHWRAAQYVLGSLADALDDDERRVFEAALVDPGSAESAALRVARSLVGEIALSAPPVAAPTGMRERLLARIRADRSSAGPALPASAPVAASGHVFKRHDDGGFDLLAGPGVHVRVLHIDAAANRATVIARLEPGASYPPHRHGGIEECYVLSGDLRHGDRVMRGGDYERVETGSLHGRQWTEEGCLLLIHSSLADEVTT
ncbi:MAG: hypothetical protein EXS13_07065 [Planctomycetes bacterium]|nr:hypothetical protein [Planctomycetota bacterium]